MKEKFLAQKNKPAVSVTSHSKDTKTRYAFTWNEYPENTASINLSEDKKSLHADKSREAIFKVIASANWSLEEKGKFRRMVASMNNTDVMAFGRKIRSLK